MKLNEFVSMLNLQIINFQEITVIIPVIKDRAKSNEINLGNFEIGYDSNPNSEDAKKNLVIFDASECSIFETEMYEKYDIKPLSAPKDIGNEVFVLTSNDSYRYIEDIHGQIYVIIN